MIRIKLKILENPDLMENLRIDFYIYKRNKWNTSISKKLEETHQPFSD